MRFSHCGAWGRESLALTVVELVGLSHHGHRDGAAVGLVEEAVVGARLQEGHLPLAVEVEGIYQDQAPPFTRNLFHFCAVLKLTSRYFCSIY